ncbi:alpha/beta hydrolase [Paraburkholderia lycopersici]|uniref:Phospholipase/carboxylesterase n=1 Tax=Paraburkholderia lycopersici TaxID=416944 RepID=A0A1G7DFM8_9BURK|nr:dienelactone hydrolase family protein [Paraburkholderia lycopersici]SDE50323.1 phospholipase/carboxylesterase [Paraburkholderia lycopersici]
MSWESFEGGWRLAPAVGAARALVVLLHGVGSNAQDLMPLADAWRRDLPGVAFASLDGSEPFDGGFGGRQWFSLRDISEANREARVVAASQVFERRLDAELAHWGLGHDALALVGFSQGSIMSLYHAATQASGAAAVVAYAGRLVTPVVAKSRTALTLVHGADDLVIPASELERAATAFSDAGFAVAAYALPGVGHTITPQGAMLGRDALVRSLGRESNG